MSIKGKRVIFAGPADGTSHKPRHTRGVVATQTLMPGRVLKEIASGFIKNEVPATTFGEQLIISDIDRVRNKMVDDVWEVGESIVAILPRSGEFINILFNNGQVLKRGDPVSRDVAFGILKKAVVSAVVGITSEEIIGYSDENVTTPEGTNLVRVRIA